MKSIAPWVCAVFLSLAHVLIVVSTLVDTQGSGEGQAFLVLFYDFPLVVLLQNIPWGGYILYSSVSAYVWFFSIAGTLMHGIAGFGVGVLYNILKLRIVGDSR